MKTYIFIVLLTHVLLMTAALKQFKKQPKSLEYVLTILVLAITMVALGGQIYFAYFYK